MSQSTTTPSFSLTGRIWDNRFWVLVAIGVLGILFSIIVDMAAALGEVGLSDADRLKHLGTPWYANVRIWADLLRDIGFASFIALALGVFVERVARVEQQRISQQYLDRQERAVEQSLEQIARNVLQGVYQIRTPQSIVHVAISEIFAKPIVRSNLNLTFQLAELPATAQANGRHLKLAMTSVSDLRNVSGVAATHDIRVALPLPNSAELRGLARVVSGAIGNEALTEALIKEGDAGAQDTAYEKKYMWHRTIDREDSLKVVMNYELIKEISDNEVWMTLLPSESIYVTVDIQCEGLEWDVDSRHAGIVKAMDGPPEGPRSSPARVLFQLEGPLLPYQGITVWWRPKQVPLLAGPVREPGNDRALGTSGQV